MKRAFRRILMATSGILLVGASTAAAEDTLTVTSWGGAYTKSQEEAYYKPYQEMTGTKILSEDYPGGLAEVKAQVESGKVTWDVVASSREDAERGCEEGLFEPIDSSILPATANGGAATDDFLPGTVGKCAVGTAVWSTIFAYDDSKFKNAKPTTIADFFDISKFPGKRGLRKTPESTLEFALMADGVATEEVYDVLATPEGVDRAFKKLDTIKKDVVWWEAGAQAPQLLADSEVVMTTAYNGRIFDAKVVENKPFVIVWDHQIWTLDMWTIPKGSSKVDQAKKFIAFASEPSRQAAQASWISYSPPRKSAIDLIGTHAVAGVPMQPNMPTAPANFANALESSVEFWANYHDELNERFNAWLTK